ncbi:MAG: hypothetical protein CME64_11235 [Halobacteriovoraceae bacterium]|nr:hypothetical protein [Halobacteriovoraceae bacterium]
MNEDGTQVYSGNSYGDGKLATFVLNNFNSLPCTLKFRSCSLKKAENYDDFILLYVNEKDSESFSTSKGHRANSINTIRKVVEFFQKQGICKVSGLELLDN